MSADAPSVLSRDRIEGMFRGVVCILDAEDKTTTRNVHYSMGLSRRSCGTNAAGVSQETLSLVNETATENRRLTIEKWREANEARRNNAT